MNRAHTKHLALARTAFRQRLSERAALLGRIAFYFLILLVFACVWRAIFAAHRAPAPSAGNISGNAAGNVAGNTLDGAARYIWYLAFTEWVMLSQPALHLEIEEDVRSGDIAYQLARPISYVGAKLAAGAGDLALRLLVLAPCGIAFGRLFSGAWVEPRALALAALAGCGASLVLLLSYAAIGLCAFWLHDCTPVYLVWQKLAFVLGGLMLPLSIHPEWLRALALRLPFAALLYRPGQLLLHPNAQLLLQLLLQLAAWVLVAAGVVIALERRGRRTLELLGG